LVFNVIIALTLMELGIYQTFEHTLGVYAIVAVAWMATVFTDLVVNKTVGLSPKGIEFKRAYLYDVNPVGMGAMILSTILGMLCYAGVFGEVASALAHFVTIIVALIATPAIAVLTKSQFYIARAPDSNKPNAGSVASCVICLNQFENEDTALCPAYNGSICSLCCSLDVRCHDSCKDEPTFIERVSVYVSVLIPSVLGRSFNHYFAKFTFLFLVIISVIGSILLLVLTHVSLDNETVEPIIADTLWKIFWIFAMVSGVVSWFFILAHKSSQVAEKESQKQNQLLMKEIKAHKVTDLALQNARQQADSANNAKSRYVAGISHELRTPLNSILGYAQLLGHNKAIPEKAHNQLSVIRSSGEHLADLIEGLLDISKIEAGRLVLYRNKVNLVELMALLESMFSLQAQSKGLKFKYIAPYDCPKFVNVDEKRLRQILINLLSNAIKFTQQGQVTLALSYRNEVAKFEISDTGVGIDPDEIERVFKPFERIRRAGVPNIQGTGLGLTITKLLTDIMGGDLALTNNEKGGLTTVVSLMLPKVFHDTEAEPPKLITGYQGERKVIAVIDDDPNHRGVISDYLIPLGFTVLEAHDCDSCLALFKDCEPDLALMDISMPEITGWEIVEKLKTQNYLTPIVMVSASSGERRSSKLKDKNGFLAKPVKLDELTNKLSEYLSINWDCEPDIKPHHNNVEDFDVENNALPEELVLKELLDLIKVGHLSGFADRVDGLLVEQQNAESDKSYSEFLSYMKVLINNVELARIQKTIENALSLNGMPL